MEWLPKGQTVRCNRWRKFDRRDKTQEVRYVREIILARREVEILGDYDRPDNARKFNLVCDDRNWVEI